MKLGIIGSGMIVHDFLTTADQVANMTVTAISSTKRSENIARELAKSTTSNVLIRTMKN